MKQKLFTFLLAIVASIGTINAQSESGNVCCIFMDSIITRFKPPMTFIHDTIRIFYEVSFCDTMYFGDIVIPALVEYKGDTSQVNRIGCEAFANCTGLTSITCWAITPPTVCADAFKGVDCSNIPLFVPAESVGAYKTAFKWKEFNPILPIGTQSLYQVTQQPKTNCQKKLKDGNILIIRENKTYTLQGQETK